MRALCCLLGAAASLLPVVSGCAVKDRDCLPNEYTMCAEGVTYWMDTCGNRGDVAETCECGCNADYSGCQSPCQCVPNCDGRQCGPDGCDGSCGDCDTGEQCNPNGQCVGPGCGNGVLEGSEQCDGTDFGDQSCLTAAGHDSGQLECTDGCYLDLTGCYTCGNGNREVAEECDGDLLGDASCWSFGYYPAELGCTAECTYDLSACIAAGRCGDGIINGGEECDGSDLGGADCLQLGYDGGELACGTDCRLVTSACLGCGPDPCEGVACSGHGTCQVTDCEPRCECEPGYYAPPGALRCLEEGQGDPCEGVTCSGHGFCDVDANLEPVCICEAGYGPGPEGLTCTEECAWIHYDLTSVPPNLFLAVDKSGSMSLPITSQDTTIKLAVAQAGLSQLLNLFADSVRFGWMEFPTDETCAPGAVAVECSALAADEIKERIELLGALGGTPTGPSLEVANQYQGLHDTARANYLMLLTDGLPNCPTGQGTTPTPEDAELALEAVLSLHGGEVETFVVGLGQDLNNPVPDLMNRLAVSGGRPLAGEVRYHLANSQAQLEQALEQIGQTAVHCNLNLDRAPGQVDHLWVLIDGVPVSRDAERLDGWDLDPVRSQLLFYGSPCERLRAGEVGQVEVREGCLVP